MFKNKHKTITIYSVFILSVVSMPMVVLAMEDGVHKEMHDSGMKKSEFAVFKGSKEGAFKEFYETGEIKVEGYYKKNKLHGKYIEYYKNGTIKVDMIYRLGICRKYQALDQAGATVSATCPKAD